MSYQRFQVVKKYSSETLFNFIKANIVKDYRIKPKGVVSFLKANPKAISKIDIRKASDLFRIFSVLSISESEIDECYKAIKDYALLTNDAFPVATMKWHGITNIATNDEPFPSCLLFGRTKEGRPIHAVCAYSKENNITIIITTYEPSINMGIDYRKRRV